MSYSRWINSRFYTYMNMDGKLCIHENKDNACMYISVKESKELRDILSRYIYDFENDPELLAMQGCDE